jgi:hypothetical protein
MWHACGLCSTPHGVVITISKAYPHIDLVHYPGTLVLAGYPGHSSSRLPEMGSLHKGQLSATSLEPPMYALIDIK